VIPFAPAVALLAVALLAGGSARAQHALGGKWPEAAQVLRADGETVLLRGTSISTPVRIDVPIRSGDRIRTGPTGRVQLRFTDGALMSIAPDSDFRVEDYAFDAQRQRSVHRLVHGTVRVLSGRIGKREHTDFRLHTPTATIGIRGTEFVVEETRCPASGCPAGVSAGLGVTVIAGRVFVSNQAGSIDVPAGGTLRLADARTAPALGASPAAAPGMLLPGNPRRADPSRAAPPETVPLADEAGTLPR
jgi:hypothetical protein